MCVWETASLILSGQVPILGKSAKCRTLTVFIESKIRSKKKFFLTLNMKTRIKVNLKLKKHIKKHVKFHFLRMSNIMIETNRDSRDYFLDEMWRNTIRRQLNFSKLQIDFLTMRFTSKFSTFENALLVYDLMISATKISWHDVLEYIANDISKYIFTYTLHVVNETKFDYEYSDILLKIQKNIHLTIDKDIAVKSAEKIHQFDK
jgi:hypothetical protein